MIVLKTQWMISGILQLQRWPKVYSPQLRAEPFLLQRHLLRCSQAPWPWGPVPEPANPLHTAVRAMLLPGTWKHQKMHRRWPQTNEKNGMCVHILTYTYVHAMTWHEVTLHYGALHCTTLHYIRMHACMHGCMDARMHVILYYVHVMLGFVVFGKIQVR